MSHFTVLVIGPNPEEQLAPYDENLEGVENPKWDWYQLGGRWTGIFKLKDGASGQTGQPGAMTERAKPGWVDQCRKGDIDIEATLEKKREQAKEVWFKYLNDKVFAPFVGIREGDTLESLTARWTSIATFAVVKDGKWYERGEMGWWGITINEKSDDVWQKEFDELFKSLPDDTLLSLYDCHI